MLVTNQTVSRKSRWPSKRQSICQPAKQAGPIWLAQGDDNRPAVTGESEWNRVEEILVRGDENRAGLLSMVEQFIVRRAWGKMIQGVRSGMAGGDKLRNGWTRKVFVEEKLHPAGSGFDGFHGRQLAGEFQAGANIGLGQRGIMRRISEWDCPAATAPTIFASQNAGSANDGLAVTNGRVKRDSI